MTLCRYPMFSWKQCCSVVCTLRHSSPHFNHSSKRVCVIPQCGSLLSVTHFTRVMLLLILSLQVLDWFVHVHNWSWEDCGMVVVLHSSSLTSLKIQLWTIIAGCYCTLYMYTCMHVQFYCVHVSLWSEFSPGKIDRRVYSVVWVEPIVTSKLLDCSLFPHQRNFHSQ